MNISTQMEYAENQQVTTIKINAMDIAAVELTEEEQARKAQLESSSSIADHVLALEILVRAIETSQISNGNGPR